MDVKRIVTGLQSKTDSPDQNQKLSRYLGLICSALPMLSPEYDHIVLGKHIDLLFYSNIQKVSHLEMMASIKGMFTNTDFTVEM